MFKKRFILLVFVLFYTYVNAQYPVDHNQNVLVNSKQLGEDLLLFVPDTATQILFNPARAANYNKSFFYATYNSSYKNFSYSRANMIMRIGDIIIYDSGFYYPGAQNNYSNYSTVLPTVSTAALLNISGSKWLFTFSNGIRYSDSEYIDDYSEWYSTYDPEYKRTENSNQKTDSKVSTTNAQISKIGDNSSIGIFGVFNEMNISANYFRTVEQSRIYELSNYYDYNSDKEKSENKANQYLIGASFSLIGDEWDFIGKIGYQKSDNLYDMNYTYLDHELDSTQYDSIVVHKRIFLKNGNAFSKHKPDLYHFYGYYQKQLSWLSKKDHLFAKAKAIISSGSMDYNYYWKNSNQYANQDTIYPAYTSDFTENGKMNTDDAWFNLSIGYAATIDLDDIYLLISFNPYYQYSKVKDIPFNSYNYRRYVYADHLSERQRTINSGGIKIPIYVHYSPVSWIDFYGGMTYDYAYIDLNEKYSFLTELAPNNTNLVVKDNPESKFTRISSIKSKFAGVNLKHKSGLKLQILFNNDIANFSYWDLSLGYHF